MDGGIPRNAFDVLAFDLCLFIAVHRFKLTGLHNQVAISADPFTRFLLGAPVHIFFRVQENLLVVFFVFEAEFVEIAGGTPFGTARQESSARLIVGQFVGRHLIGVVDAAGDDRAVGIAFEKLDDDFLADARNIDGAPIFTGPRLRHANPAGTVFVVLADAIPKELHFDAAVLVGIDFLAVRADDNGGLWALDKGLGGNALRSKRHVDGNTLELVGVDVLRTGVARFRKTSLNGGGVRGLGQNIVSIHVAALVAFERELVTRSESAAISGSSDDVMNRFFLFHANFSYGVAFALVDVHAGIVVNFVLGVASDFGHGLDVRH